VCESFSPSNIVSCRPLYFIFLIYKVSSLEVTIQCEHTDLDNPPTSVTAGPQSVTVQESHRRSRSRSGSRRPEPARHDIRTRVYRRGSIRAGCKLGVWVMRCASAVGAAAAPSPWAPRPCARGIGAARQPDSEGTEPPAPTEAGGGRPIAARHPATDRL